MAQVTGDPSDGFEGNAQSFRIATKLAQRREGMDGLDLCRATLNAILKYPWMWNDRPASTPEKWGAYESEREVFRWVREPPRGQNSAKTLEAEVMDWADDIAYAIHDVDDFYRAGLIPLGSLSRGDEFGEEERERFAKAILDSPNWQFGQNETMKEISSFPEEMKALGSRSFDGSPEMRRALKTYVSKHIGNCIEHGATLGTADAPLSVGREIELKVSVLKQLTHYYVLNGPEVATQRRGQKRIVGELFDEIFEAIRDNEWSILPIGFRRWVESAYADSTAGEENIKLAARLAADFVASLTEQQAFHLHRRVTGAEMGRLMSPPV